MNDRHDSNHDDSLDKATRAYHSQNVPDGPPEEFVTEVLAALRHAEQAANQPSTINLKQRILSMKLTTKIAIAATVLIALGGLLAWLAPGEGTALAFTNVAEAFASIRTVTCKVNSEVDMPQGKMETSGKWMYMAPSRERHESFPSQWSSPDGSMKGGTTGSVSIFDHQKGESITLSPETKMAMVLKLENVPADRPGNSFGQLRKMVLDAQHGRADKVEKLGQRTIDGHETVGFRICQGAFDFKIWADPDTGLPVRVELTGIQIKPKVRVLMNDFRINLKLDESLFSLDVPEGYTVHRVSMDASEPTLDDLAKTLRVVAEHNDGTFPAELHGVEGIMGVITKSVIAKHGPDNTPEIEKAMVEFAPKTARGSAFVMTLSPENDYRYVGKDVKLNTPNRPIFWYKPTESKKYRVIYADLSIKDVAPEDLGKRTFRRTVTKRTEVKKKVRVKVDPNGNGKITIQED